MRARRRDGHRDRRRPGRAMARDLATLRMLFQSRWARLPVPDQMITRRRPAASGGQTSARSGPARGPAWPALLEAQWQARLQQVTELSLAYHDAAAAAASAPTDRGSDRKLRQVRRRTAA